MKSASGSRQQFGGLFLDRTVDEIMSVVYGLSEHSLSKSHFDAIVGIMEKSWVIGMRVIKDLELQTVANAEGKTLAEFAILQHRSVRDEARTGRDPVLTDIYDRMSLPGGRYLDSGILRQEDCNEIIEAKKMAMFYKALLNMN